MKKKVLALVLMLVVLASVLAMPAAAVGGKTFPDAKGHWAEESIMRWSRSGLVNGDDLGNVNPNKPLRRCEMATILSNMLGLRTAAPISTFRDIDGTEWYARAILRCAAAGIMLGSNDSMSLPEDYITREEAITMFCRALNVPRDEDPDLSKFSDGDEVSGWAAPFMATLTELGILSGMGDGTVAPHDNINRAGAFVLMDKAISVYANAPGTYTSQNANGFVVINSNDYQNGDVILSGKAKGVLVSVNTTDTVRLRDLTAENVDINGKGSVIIAGKSSLDNVEAHTEIDMMVEANATVDTLDINSEKITLTNGGTVKNLNCDKVATVTNSGKVENLVADAAISITNTGTVDKLVANAGITVDNNKGTIKNAEINKGGVVMDGAPQQMTVATGVTRPSNSSGRPISATGAVSSSGGGGNNTQTNNKGTKKVIFKDGDTVLQTSTDSTGKGVTAPDTPESTENVYYTGEWLDKDNKVVDKTAITVGTVDTTYTAQKFEVTNTVLSVRMDGPEGNHGPEVTDFKYSTVYAEAGLTLQNSTIEVETDKLTAMVNSEDADTANNLAHIMGNGTLANEVVFGIAYKTPGEAKQVAFAGTVAGLATVSAEQYRDLATHPSCYNNTLISYIPVATIAPDTKEVTFAKNGVADSDFCKWMDEAGNIVAVTKTVIRIKTDNAYTVTFQNGDEVVKTEEVEKGDTVAIPEGKEILTAEGKGFLGWYVGETKYDGTAHITEDTVVTAKWTENIPTTEGLNAAYNAVASKLGITAEAENGVVTITIPADVKEKFEELTDAEKGQLNHEDRLYVRVNSNVPAGADGNWFFQGSTDNGVTWRAKVEVTKEALASKGINVTEANGAIATIGQWFSFATVDNASGDNFALITPAGDWTVIYRWTNAKSEMQYTTFQVKFVHAGASE